LPPVVVVLVVVVVSPPDDSSRPAEKLPAGINIFWDTGDAKHLFHASKMRHPLRAESKRPIWDQNRYQDFTNDILIGKLAEKGIEAKGDSKQVQAMCAAQNILTKYEETEIKEGWEGKAKGTEQILWERGWIDAKRPRKDYTKLGTKDSMGPI
jgi:hypothetical protein